MDVSIKAEGLGDGLCRGHLGRALRGLEARDTNHRQAALGLGPYTRYFACGRGSPTQNSALGASSPSQTRFFAFGGAPKGDTSLLGSRVPLTMPPGHFHPLLVGRRPMKGCAADEVDVVPLVRLNEVKHLGRYREVCAVSGGAHHPPPRSFVAAQDDKTSLVVPLLPPAATRLSDLS